MSTAGESRPSSSARRIWNVFKILLALALVWFVLSKTSLQELGDLLGQISPAWLAISFVLFCLLTLTKAFQYYLLIGRQAAYGRVLSVVITQNAVSNFIAAGAGIVSYLTLLSVDEGVRLRRVVSTFIITKIGDLVAVWLALGLSSLLVWDQVSGVQGIVVVLLVATPLAVGMFLGVIVFRRKVAALLARAVRLLHLERVRFAQRGLEIFQFLSEQQADLIWHALLAGLLVSLIYMALTMIWVYAILRTFSMVIPPSIVVYVNAWMQLISWLPIQVFGGLGVNETSQVYLYGLFGIPQAQMATVSLGMRALLYLFNLIVLLYLPISTLFYRKGERRT